jgi:PAS domain S-box-containing protein
MLFKTLITAHVIEQTITPYPLMVSQQTLVTEVIARMDQVGMGANCALVMAENELVGIFTQRDVLRLCAEGRQFLGIAIADVMTRPVVTIKKFEFTDISAVLNIFHEHQIRYLPVMDDHDQVTGIVTETSLINYLQSLNKIELSELQQGIDQLIEDLYLQTQALKQEVNRRKTLFKTSFDGIVIIDLQGNVVESNESFARMLGYSLEEMPNLNVSDWDALWSKAEVLEKIHEVHLKSATFETLHRRKDGSIYEVEISANSVQWGDKTYKLCVCRNITERKQAEESLKNLVEGAAACTGRDFFPVLAEYIATALQIRYVLVTKQIGKYFETYAFWADGQIQANFIGCLENTPCGLAMIEGMYCCRENVQQQFPGNEELVALGAESYLGIALKNSQGETIGSLCVLDDQPLRQESRTIAMLRVFAARISAELERYEAIQALHQLNQDLEALVTQRTQALQASEARYRLLMDEASDCILLADIKGNILHSNRRTEALLNFTQGELIGKHYTLLFTAEELARGIAAFNTLVKNKRVELLDTLLLRKDGTTVPIDITASVVEINGEQIIQAIFRDISEQKTRLEERKKIESQLQKSATHLSMAQRIAHLGSWEYEVKTGEIMWSEEIFRIFGLNPALGVPSYQELLQYVHPSDRDRHNQVVDQAIITKKPQELEYRLLRPDGKLRYVHVRTEVIANEEGEVIRLVGTASDITDRKNAELELIRNRDLRDAIFNQSTDGIFLVDPQKFWILDCNQRAVELFEANREEDLTTTNINLLQKQPFSEAELREIKAEMKTKGFLTREIEYVTKKGNCFWGNLASKTMVIAGTQINLVRVTDISDRKKAEEELKLVNEQLSLTNAELDRATRLKDEFLANMSHELRTPLNAVLGMSEALQDDVFGELNDRQKGAIATIERSGQHLLELINDILDLSKVEAGKLEFHPVTVFVRDLCESSITFVKQQAHKKGIQLKLEIAPKLPTLIADPLRIRQVLINLLNNAVKFTPEGGSVELRVQIDVQAEMDFLAFSVTDTGIGIATSDLDKLFKPFVQIDSKLNRQYNGTGLGLALVRRLVELHGGKVEVTSTIGQGSCFTVYFPCTGTPAESTAENTSSSPNQHSVCLTPINQNQPNTALILLVNDNEVNITTVGDYLSQKGYRVIIAKNEQDAVNLAQENLPDLVIVDINIGGINALEVTQKIRADEVFRNIPIIALTASNHPSEVEKLMAAGINEFFQKPIKLKVLTQKIQQILQK